MSPVRLRGSRDTAVAAADLLVLGGAALALAASGGTVPRPVHRRHR
ncbi:hypothetical protein [Streptomyces sp. NPDC001348]